MANQFNQSLNKLRQCYSLLDLNCHRKSCL